MTALLFLRGINQSVDVTSLQLVERHIADKWAHMQPQRAVVRIVRRS
ncbi:MAG: hypothetical protein ACXVAF_15305 [Vulcanimicrobiaceae bacterium]